MPTGRHQDLTRNQLQAWSLNLTPQTLPSAVELWWWLRVSMYVLQPHHDLQFPLSLWHSGPASVWQPGQGPATTVGDAAYQGCLNGML